jgi:hypothetical protein
MTTTITYDYLWETFQKEKATNQLLPISRTFYTDALFYINGLSGKGESESATKANSTSILNNLFEKRRQKILIYIAYGKPLPQPISNMEQELCNKVLDILKVNKLDGTNIKSTDKVSLRSLKDMQEVILPSGNKAGPFKKDQIMELGNQESDIAFLLGNEICERL